MKEKLSVFAPLFCWTLLFLQPLLDVALESEKKTLQHHLQRQLLK